jgi:hypothetical protein
VGIRCSGLCGISRARLYRLKAASQPPARGVATPGGYFELSKILASARAGQVIAAGTSSGLQFLGAQRRLLPVNLAAQLGNFGQAHLQWRDAVLVDRGQLLF